MKIMMAIFRNLAGISGGLERGLCDLSNMLVARGHDVTIVYDSPNSGKPYYPLDERVGYINLSSWKVTPKISFIGKIHREVARARGKTELEGWQEKRRDPVMIPLVKKAITQITPDIILVHEPSSSGFLYRAQPACPVLTMFHNSPDYLFSKTSTGELEGMRHSAAIQVQLPGFISDVKKILPESAVYAVPNNVPQVADPVDLSCPKEQYSIINVARLNRESKRQHILVNAFSMVADKFPNWNVYLWGKDKNKYENELHQLIRKLRLEKRVFLMGTTKQIMEEYRKADLFAFPSSHEGFPRAMTEAMSMGLPVVGCRSCASVRDIVENGVTGVLTEDSSQDFARGLCKLMEDQGKRSCMGRNAHAAMKRYAPELIWDEWETLLEKVSKQSLA